MKFIKIEFKNNEVHYIPVNKCDKIVYKNKKIQSVEYRYFEDAICSEHTNIKKVSDANEVSDYDVINISLVNDDELLED